MIITCQDESFLFPENVSTFCRIPDKKAFLIDKAVFICRITWCMKSKLRVLSEVSGLRTTLFAGEAEIVADSFSYREAGSGAFTRITILEDGLEILREDAQIRSELFLREGKAEARIGSAEGSFILDDIEVLEFRREPKRITLTYRVGETRKIVIEL